MHKHKQRASISGFCAIHAPSDEYNQLHCVLHVNQSKWGRKKADWIGPHPSRINSPVEKVSSISF